MIYVYDFELSYLYTYNTREIKTIFGFFSILFTAFPNFPNFPSKTLPALEGERDHHVFKAKLYIIGM